MATCLENLSNIHYHMLYYESAKCSIMKENFKKLDKFYTNIDVVCKCMKNIDQDKYEKIIEPSVGDGSFYNLLDKDKALGIDIEPCNVSLENKNIQKADYLTYDIESYKTRRTLVIGNPPFGKSSSLAVKFFNKSSEFADTIAFIVPRTFRKRSIINRLNEHYHLRSETILPPNSFHFPDGTIKNVNTVWQIWDKKRIKRKKIPQLKQFTTLWEWTDRQNADFSIRRVGCKAGKLLTPTTETSISSHFFIKTKHESLQEMFSNVWIKHWVTLSDNSKWDTAGNPSLTKGELVHLLEQEFELSQRLTNVLT